MDLLWRQFFVDHPHSVGESYAAHFAAAARFGLRLFAAGAACWVHALVPGWCTRTGSRAVAELAREMSARAAYAEAETAARASSSSASASLQSLSRS